MFWPTTHEFCADLRLNICAMVKTWFSIERDGHPTIDTDLDTNFFKIPIVGWMTLNHIPCFDRGTNMNEMIRIVCSSKICGA